MKPKSSPGLRRLLLCVLCRPWFAHSAGKPNVLFITSDDLGRPTSREDR